MAKGASTEEQVLACFRPQWPKFEIRRGLILILRTNGDCGVPLTEH
jgi:hypothetical protein